MPQAAVLAELWQPLTCALVRFFSSPTNVQGFCFLLSKKVERFTLHLERFTLHMCVFVFLIIGEEKKII